MSFNIVNVLKGISGQFEITRVLGALGVLAYILGAHIFVGWTVFHEGKAFDVVAYCAAFPAGLAVAIGVIAEAAGRKDKAVQIAQTIRDTGSMPGVAPTDTPMPVTVTNPPSNPANVQEQRP